jgi:hypothetical protein
VQMVGIFARGRIAWILGLVLGVVLLIVGLVMGETWAIITGSGFGLFGLIFLIISLVTRGQSD